MDIETGLICLVLGFIAGYIFCGWEVDRILREMDARVTKMENDNYR